MATPEETKLVLPIEECCSQCFTSGVTLSKESKQCIYCFNGETRPLDSPFQPPFADALTNEAEKLRVSKPTLRFNRSILNGDKVFLSTSVAQEMFQRTFNCECCNNHATFVDNVPGVLIPITAKNAGWTIKPIVVCNICKEEALGYLKIYDALKNGDTYGQLAIAAGYGFEDGWRIHTQFRHAIQQDDGLRIKHYHWIRHAIES